MKTLFTTMIIALSLALFLGLSTQAFAADKQGEEAVVSVKQCINASRIWETDVIDNQTIVFHMYGNKSWVNNLPYACPNLYIEGFSYNLQIDKLCNTDIITVLNIPAKCGLGTFEPYSEKSEDNES